MYNKVESYTLDMLQPKDGYITHSCTFVTIHVSLCPIYTVIMFCVGTHCFRLLNPSRLTS